MVIDRDNIKILLFLLIVGLGLGYAYINSDLNINGTAQVNSANWDVHWANIQVKNGSVSGTNVVTEPTISNSTTVNYSVILSQPGDYYEFTVDAVNAGSIDAMIDTIDSKLNGVTITTLPTYLEYTITYEDGIELEENHELLHSTSETYKLKIKFRDDISASALPSANQNLSLQFTVTYRQKNDQSIAVPHPFTGTIYTANISTQNAVHLRQRVPSSITKYTTGTEALAALRTATGDNSIQFYLKHTVEEDIVVGTYVVFIVTPEMATEYGMTAGTYELQGGEEGYGFGTREYIGQAFGSSHCSTSYVSAPYKQISCHISNWTAFCNDYGYVSVSNGNHDCFLSYSGDGSYCN